MACRHRSRHQGAAPRGEAIGDSRRGPRSISSSSSDCSRPTWPMIRRKSQSSRRTRFCCASGVCCRGGWLRTATRPSTTRRSRSVISSPSGSPKQPLPATAWQAAMTDRCDRCSASLALVGVAHRRTPLADALARAVHEQQTDQGSVANFAWAVVTSASAILVRQRLRHMVDFPGLRTRGLRHP
jgi:hypothetical protein